MPQVIPFDKTTKACVIHKLLLNPRGKASVWIGADGALLGVEYFPHVGSRRTHPVKVGGPLWRAIESAARPYIPTPCPKGWDGV